MPAIQLNSLSKNYGSRRGVVDLNLEIPPSVLYGFLGPNGAGKTTTLRILAGLIRASSGSAQVLGRDCWHGGASLLSRVGYLPGDLRLWPWLNAERALNFVQRVRKLDLGLQWGRLISKFELDPTVPVRKMSRGMRQKLGLVMALAHDPEVLILDEPTSGLDPIMQGRLASELEARAGRGCCVIFSSHTLAEVESLCQWVGVVRRGRLVSSASLQAMKERAERRFRVDWPAAHGASLEPFDGVQWTRTEGPTWIGRLKGDAREALNWALANGATDLTLEEPDLEALFHSYYCEDGTT